MKLVFLFTSVLLTIPAFASSEVLLTLKRERPAIDCEISRDSVKISRVSQGVRFIKQISYQIDDLAPMIKKAYESRDLTSVNRAEHGAFYQGNNSDEVGSVYFNLDSNEPTALKLINLISTLCELRNF